MKTNDVILFSVGLALGYFLKSSLDKRNVVATEQVGDVNYVFSQKYKDCEAKVNNEMAVSKYAGTIDLVALEKSMIEECMKSTT